MSDVPPPRTPPRTPPRGSTTTAATDFLNGLILATTALMEEQIGRWSRAVQQMRQGTYEAGQFQRDLVQMWDPWIALATFPFRWGTQASTSLPTILFIVDGVAETVGPFKASLNISLEAGVTPRMGDLYPIEGTQRFNPAHIQVELTPEGDQLSVRLVDLGSGETERNTKGLHPGFYVGPVYAVEGATRRPLALVYVLIEEPSQPEGPQQ